MTFFCLQLVTEVDASDLTDLSDLVGPELATLVTPCSPPAADHQAASAVAGSAGGGISMDIRHGQTKTEMPD
jgi:hypothetical protein